MGDGGIAVGPQRDGLVFRQLVRHRADDQLQVGVVAAHHLGDEGVGVVDLVQLHIRVDVQILGAQGGDKGKLIGAAAQHEPVFLLSHEVVHIVVDKPELAHIAVGGLVEPLAGGGQLHLVGIPVKKQCAQLLLQSSHLP